MYRFVSPSPRGANPQKQEEVKMTPKKKYPMTAAIAIWRGAPMLLWLHVDSTQGELTAANMSTNAKAKGHTVTGQGSFLTFYCYPWVDSMIDNKHIYLPGNIANKKKVLIPIWQGTEAVINRRTKALMRSIRAYNTINKLGHKMPPKNVLVQEAPEGWTIIL